LISPPAAVFVSAVAKVSHGELSVQGFPLTPLLETQLRSFVGEMAEAGSVKNNVAHESPQAPVKSAIFVITLPMWLVACDERLATRRLARRIHEKTIALLEFNQLERAKAIDYTSWLLNAQPCHLIHRTFWLSAKASRFELE
jgi:hypothetical protein